MASDRITDNEMLNYITAHLDHVGLIGVDRPKADSTRQPRRNRVHT